MKTFKSLLVLISLGLIVMSFSSKPKPITLIHEGYTSHYDTILNYPIEVEWWATKSRLDCPDTKIPRKDQFDSDPLLPAATDLATSYKGSGLDRGHMCPAADNQCSEKLQTECFYFSNMAPQYHSLNAGVWKTLETRTRELALKYDSVKVWCGSVGIERKIGKVAVPTRCWKVVFVKKTKSWEAYIFSNSKVQEKELGQLAVPLDSVKKLTGLQFQVK